MSMDTWIHFLVFLPRVPNFGVTLRINGETSFLAKMTVGRQQQGREAAAAAAQLLNGVLETKQILRR